MRLLLVCLLLLGSSRMGTDAFSLNDLWGINSNTASPSVPLEHAPDRAPDASDAHNMDEENNDDTQPSHEHQHGNAQTDMDSDMVVPHSHSHQENAPPHHNLAHTHDNQDSSSQRIQNHGPYEAHHRPSFRFDERMSLAERRRSNQWTGTNDVPSPPDHPDHDQQHLDEDGHSQNHHHKHNHTHPHHNNTDPHHNHDHPYPSHAHPHPNHTHPHHNNTDPHHNHDHPHPSHAHPHPNHAHPHHHHGHLYRNHARPLDHQDPSGSHLHNHGPYQPHSRRTSDESVSLGERQRNNPWTGPTYRKTANNNPFSKVSYNGPIHSPQDRRGFHRIPGAPLMPYPPQTTYYGPRNIYGYPFIRSVPPYNPLLHDSHSHHFHRDNSHPSIRSPASKPPPPSPTPRRRCPMLYSSVGGRCIAIFSIARMSWNDAKQFCDGIFGELFMFNHPQEYRDMAVFLRQVGLSSPLWVGGRASPKGWQWLDERSMPLGTPYWAIRHASGDDSAITQCPANERSDDSSWCAAMNADDYYYISDAECDDHKAPVCVLRDDAKVVVAQGDTKTYYPALDPGFCQNWMVTGRDEGGKEVFSEESDSSEDSDESSEESSEEDSEEGGEESSEEESSEEGGDESSPTTTTPSGDEGNEEETGSGAGSTDGVGEDDEDFAEGSGYNTGDTIIDYEYAIQPKDYEAVNNLFLNY